MGTDGWGQLSFYYDYERSEKRPFKPERMRGLVLKSYKFTGVNGIILHAYNGVKYFMGRFDNKNAYFSPVDRNGNIDVSDRTIWARLSAAFDVFFDLEEIEFGYDDGKGVLSHIEEYVGKSDKDIAHALECGAQEFGHLAITFTGDPQEGYSLKFRYYYGEEEYCDLRSVIEQYNEDFGSWADDGFPEESINKAIDFFEENSVHDEDFDTCADIRYIKELIKEIDRKIKAFEALRGTDEEPVDMSGFSVKTFNSLLRAKVNTIGDLKALLSGESSDIKLSKSTIEELTRFLEERKNNSTEQ